MQQIILSNNKTLDDFVYLLEFAKLANINANSYRYWANGISARYDGGKAVFLHKQHIIKKHLNIIPRCTSLDGLVSASAFCALTGLAPSHLNDCNDSSLLKILDIKMIENVKFVHLKSFYEHLGIEPTYNVYIEKCKYFSPTPLEKRIKITKTLCVGYY
jgi:hypothetical protein